MIKANSYRSCQRLRPMVLLISACSMCSILRMTMGQPEDVPADLRDRVPIIGPDGRVPPDGLPAGMVDEQGRLVAHVHNANMSCCAPCAPEENSVADVFRRACFLRALGKSRQAGEAAAGLTLPGGVEIPGSPTASTRVKGFESVLERVLTARFLPATWDDARPYAPYGLRARVVESRGGVRTFVGYDLARDSELNEVTEGGTIQATWTVDGVDVLPRARYEPIPKASITIRLRLHGDDRIDIRPRVEELSEPGAWRQFFDHPALHHFLTSVFQVPFEDPDDWFTYGFDATYEGVRVFHGYILAEPRWKPWVGGDDPPQHWWEQMRLLVTDSDPQYFCVEIVLREGDALDAP